MVLEKYFEKKEQLNVLKDALTRGESILILGKVGVGKTTLLKLILKEFKEIPSTTITSLLQNDNSLSNNPYNKILEKEMIHLCFGDLNSKEDTEYLNNIDDSNIQILATVHHAGSGMGLSPWLYPNRDIFNMFLHVSKKDGEVSVIIERSITKLNIPKH